MTIIFYDIASRNQECLSTNTLRTPLCLRFKGIPFKTEWIDLSDIENFCIENGIEATSKKPDGSPFYTFPAIHDPSTGTKLADSWKIALYLDKMYPDAPLLLPRGTIALQRAFTDAIQPIFTPGAPFIIQGILQNITPSGVTHYRKSLERRFGKSAEELILKGNDATAAWAGYRESLDKLDAWYAASDGPFLTGEAPVWADLIVGSMFLGQRILWGKEDEWRWKEVVGWHNGRWGRLVQLLEERSIV